MVPNLGIFVFEQNLELGKLEGTDFKFDNIAFKPQSKNTQISDFWSQILAFLFLFCNFLQLDKFEGSDFKYGYSFLKYFPKNTQIRHF